MSMFWTTLKLQEPSAKKLVLGSTWLSSLSNLPTRLECSANTHLLFFMQDSLPGLRLEPGQVRPPDLETAVAVLEAHGDQVWKKCKYLLIKL